MPALTLRQKVHRLLEPAEGSGGIGRWLDLFLIALIAVNVISVILETVGTLQADYGPVFLWIEYVSVVVFTAEYAARLWTAPEHADHGRGRRPRLTFALSPMAIIDLLAIAPFYLSFFLALDLRFLRVLRLLRILKLTRYSSAINMLMDVFKEEASAFFAAFFILIVVLIIAASGAYLAEHQIQPEGFGSIPAAMWWAIVTLTTVGYGDVSPITWAGKLFGSVVAVVGIGMAALPAGILASGMAEQMRRRREELAQQFRKALEDGEIDMNEAQTLIALRKKLGLNRHTAKEIMAEVRRDRAMIERAATCPHCGKSIEAHA